MGIDTSPREHQVLSVKLEPDTYERWSAFAAENRVTLSALIEAIGRNLPRPGERLRLWKQIVEEAADIRLARSRRGNGRRTTEGRTT
jgi:hypothetical protein